MPVDPGVAYHTRLGPAGQVGGARWSPKATTMTKPDTLDVHALMVELNRRYSGRAPGYQRVWSMAIADRIPAHRKGSRWRFKRSDIPRIAAVLGLADPPAAA